MKKIGKLLFSSTLLLFLFACSPKKSDNVIKNKRTQENQQFKKITMGYFPQRYVENFEYWDDVPSYPSPQDDGVWTRSRFLDYDNQEICWYYDIDVDSDGLYDYRAVSYQGSCNIYKFEPIEWDILEEKDGKAIAISHLVLEKGWSSHYDYPNCFYYDKTDLRKWLNNDFYNIAFSSSEKEKIITTLVKNNKEQACTTNVDFDGLACDDTEDNVYVLSYKEAITYYKNETSRRAKATEYVIDGMDHKNNNDENQYYSWRLRGPGWNIGRAATVMDIGYITADYMVNDQDQGIRPVICIDLNN